MKLSKFGSAGIKVAGAASCGLGAALTLVMAGGAPSGNAAGIMFGLASGMAISGGILFGQAVGDVVKGFKGERK